MKPYYEHAGSTIYHAPALAAMRSLPTAIPDRLIKLFVHASDAIILDPFVGVGTTLRSAHALGYSAIGVDVSERYCKLAADSLRQGFLFRV